MVYIREAHPSDGWVVPGWSALEDADDLAGRKTNGGSCKTKLSFPFPIAADTMDDAVACRWSGWPERLFVISKDGMIVYTGDQGPFGFNPGAGYAGFRQGPSADGPPGISLEDFLAAYLRD